jgi:hypothetical protein
MEEKELGAINTLAGTIKIFSELQVFLLFVA